MLQRTVRPRLNKRAPLAGRLGPRASPWRAKKRGQALQVAGALERRPQLPER